MKLINIAGGTASCSEDCDQRGEDMPTRKFNFGDRVEGNDSRGSFCGRKGSVMGYNKGEYCIKFDDGREEWVPPGWLKHSSDLNP